MLDHQQIKLRSTTLLLKKNLARKDLHARLVEKRPTLGYSALCAYLAGTQKPGKETAILIAQVLEVEPQWLFKEWGIFGTPEVHSVGKAGGAP